MWSSPSRILRPYPLPGHRRFDFHCNSAAAVHSPRWTSRATAALPAASYLTATRPPGPSRSPRRDRPTRRPRSAVPGKALQRAGTISRLWPLPLQIRGVTLEGASIGRSRSRATMPRDLDRCCGAHLKAALGVGDEEASPRWAGCSGRSRWTIWAASGRRRRARAPNRTLTVHILTGNAPAAGRCQARRIWRVGSSPAGMGSSSTYDRRSRRSTSGSCRPKSGETTRLKCAKSAPSSTAACTTCNDRGHPGRSCCFL